MDKELKVLYESDEVQRLLKTARAFTALVERTDIDLDTLIAQSRVTLTELYAAGLSFPAIPLKHSECKDVKLELSQSTIVGHNKHLINNVKDSGYYWEVFNPIFDKEKEPTLGWLVDDFSDIYRDLREPLLKIDTIGTDAAIEDALWQLEFGFHSHWGNHCINALRALHYLAG